MHEWVMNEYNGHPQFKCTVCGFVWKHKMKKPTVTCEQILESKKTSENDTSVEEGLVLT